MLKILENAYTEYEISESEHLSAAVFSPLQQAHIKNQIAAYAKERAVLTLDHTASDPVQSYMYAQQKLLGSIEALQYLLVLHQNALDAATQIVTDRNNTQ